ncbi:S8 family serine peptidase [Actinomycetes bacterium KLBMP 9797]
MKRRRPIRARLSLLMTMSLLTVGVGVGVGAPAPDAEAARVPTTARLASSAPPRWLTLVTGDRVRISGTGDALEVVGAEGGPGRTGATFVRELEHGDTFVVPADVSPLIASGRVDRRLFNVSELVRSGYENGDLPVIVGHGSASALSAQATVKDAGGKVTHALPSISATAVRVPRSGAAKFWKTVTGADQRASTKQPVLSAGVTRVWLDGKAKASLDHSVAQVGAPAAWAAGHTGKGAKVAVLDSGIDTDHPDLADAVTAARDFSGTESGVDDRYGHGTHVAGIITGNGAAADGKYVGVAPDATLLNGKVLDDNGFGSDSGIIAGMQWAVDQGADVVNVSLGSFDPDDGTSPLSIAVNELTRGSGVLFVVAASNLGPGPGTISAPGAAEEALTVGAVDRQDAVADFSGRGPRRGDPVVKPDITAPGVGIVSALAGDSSLEAEMPAVDGRYVSLPGTSMATPHVAGAAALLAAQHPHWKAGQLKAALMGSATASGGATVYEQGAGRVDVTRAVAQPVYATPASLSLGTALWPHEDDKPVERAVAYRNDGDAPVTLELAVDVRDPAGKPAPAGMFTVDQPRLVVPAHGTAVAHLVTDTTVAAPDGTYGGVLTATAGSVTVRTPVGVTREPESYNVTLNVVDRNGESTGEYALRFLGVDNDQRVRPYDASGRFVARVPKGTYYVDAKILTPNEDSPWEGFDVAAIVEPTVSITADTTMELDGRAAEPIGFTVDQPGARHASGTLVIGRDTLSIGGVGLGFFGDLNGLFVRPSRTAAPADQFSVTLQSQYARGDGAGGFTGSPYVYNLHHVVTGRIPDDLNFRVRDRDLGRVRTEVAASATDEVALVEGVVPVPTPGHITEYFTPGVAWARFVFLKSPDAEWEHAAHSRSETLRKGDNGVRRWNVGVFGPSVRPEATAENGMFVAQRTGDVISLFGPELFTGQASDSGWMLTDTEQATLWRNGQQVGEPVSPDAFQIPVPSGAATYRLGINATQQVADFSTKVDVAWTFVSDTTPADTVTGLPVTAIRFAPRLDDHNRAPAGQPFRIPLWLERHNAAGYGTVTGVTVQVSYDDGQTWQPAQVTGAGMRRTVLVNHPPASAGFVSLKATATDSAGNSVEETIIRAYAITG